MLLCFHIEGKIHNIRVSVEGVQDFAGQCTMAVTISHWQFFRVDEALHPEKAVV
jgi:hypothetical protein